MQMVTLLAWILRFCCYLRYTPCPSELLSKNLVTLPLQLGSCLMEIVMLNLEVSGMRKGFVVYSFSHPISALPFLSSAFMPFAMCETSTNGGCYITRHMRASLDWI